MKNNLRITDHPILDIQKGRRISFQFNGRSVTAYEGETIAAALYASGVRIFSRSFKYHRPRGLFCMAGHCSNCLMRVDGVPNVRVCREPAHQGTEVVSQNAWPSLKFDLAALTGYVSFLVRPGFQYHRFIRPRWAYHIWEKFLRRMAGIGTLADSKPAAPTIRKTASPEIVVIGSGLSGLSAVLSAARTGAEVLLVEREAVLGGRAQYDTSSIKINLENSPVRRFEVVRDMAEQVEALDNCRILKNSTAFAWYDEDILAVSGPGEFWELKPGRTIIATGCYEHPMIFGNNDLPGIFTAGALQRLMHGDNIRPGNRAVVAAQVDEGYAAAKQLVEAGVNVIAIVDSRNKETALSAANTHDVAGADAPLFSGYTLKSAIGKRSIRGVYIEPVKAGGKKLKVSCDTLCVAGAKTPANELLFQRTCEGTYVLESEHQFTRKPNVLPDMRVVSADDMFAVGAACGSQGTEHALLQGKIAGLSAALDLGHGGSEMKQVRDQAVEQLRDVRGS